MPTLVKALRAKALRLRGHHCLVVVGRQAKRVVLDADQAHIWPLAETGVNLRLSLLRFGPKSGPGFPNASLLRTSSLLERHVSSPNAMPDDDHSPLRHRMPGVCCGLQSRSAIVLAVSGPGSDALMWLAARRALCARSLRWSLSITGCARGCARSPRRRAARSLGLPHRTALDRSQAEDQSRRGGTNLLARAAHRPVRPISSPHTRETIRLRRC